MHNHTMIIYPYIPYKLQEIPSFGYLVIAEDTKVAGRKDWPKDGGSDKWTL